MKMIKIKSGKKREEKKNQEKNKKMIKTDGLKYF